MPASTGEQSAGETKQTRFLALTEWGNVSLWSVHVLTSSEDTAGVQADPGLQFGGRVRLLLLAANLPMGRSFPQASVMLPYVQQLQAHAAVLALPPNQIDEFLVAGNNDCILRGSLYGQAAVPKVRCHLQLPWSDSEFVGTEMAQSSRYLNMVVVIIVNAMQIILFSSFSLNSFFWDGKLFNEALQR